MAQFTVVLVGDESLLGQCGEMLLERGHRIALVVTGSSQIGQWASSRSIDTQAWSGELAELLRPLEFDWLFSIANLRVVPDEALALARIGAVNFHDGPLPRYAGLNTPNWAILEGAASYGVTWHRMTAGIDRGNILARKNFDLDASETALTLNAKCFEAGIASFGDVLQRIESGDATGEPQPDTERHHYLKTRRPEAAALVDFSADAAAIDRLARALDFGPGYANPLLTPKVATADGLFAVTSVEIVDEGGGRSPGTVVAVDEQGAVIATTDWAVRVEGRSLADPERLLSAGLRVGDALPVPDSATRARATETVARLVPHEPAWRAALRPADDLSDRWGEASTGGAGHQALPLDLPAGWTAADAVPAIAAFFARHFGQSEFVLGYANDEIAAAAAQVPGLAAETVPLQVGLNLDQSSREARDRIAAALERVRERGTFLSDLFLRYPHLHRPAPAIGIVETAAPDRARPIDGCAITFAAGDGGVRMLVDTARIGLDQARELAGRIGIFAAGFATRDDALAALPTMSDDELHRLLVEFNDTARDYDRDACVHHLIEAQARRTPDATAVAFQERSISYAELDRAAEAVAGVLRQHGVKPDVPVGLYIPRSIELVVGALAIMKAGGAYLPLDPDFPHDRLVLMVEDSGAPVILTTSSLPPLQVPGERAAVDIATAMAGASGGEGAAKPASGNLAYVIYTSGSTGRPKGVMLEHRNVVNFFAGMDERIERGGDGQPVWLAVTSLSFDISVLELFWTLARGFKVVIHSSEVHRAHQAPAQERKAVLAKQLDFGLFYWGNDDGAGPAKYRLMLEGAKFADRNGFQAVWTPERHFHAFGGPYPNPSVSGAAIAAVTENLHIRAGSCVLPLHHPARVAEEWALVDNLSNGRVGLAFASGWMPEDFVLRPENQPPGNKAAMVRDIEVVRRLWRGEAVEFDFGDKSIPVVTQPRPVQSELPVWLTTAGNPDSYREAARLGANVLTHLLGQSIEELAGKIQIYRDTLKECGRDPDAFKVTLMLHTLVGDDREQVRELAREPMKDYLRSAAALIKQYAWAFPAFKKPAGAANPMDIDLRDLADDEMDAILEFAFERYFEDSGLFGTREDCMRRLEQVSAIGVDEIACLIDYGVPSDVVLEALKPLADVVKQARLAGGDAVAPAASAESAGDAHGFAAEVVAHGVTHLQCTPSMMRMFLASDEDRAAVGRIRHLMIGGEPLHGSLLAELRSVTSAGVQNMYGPTETTIWSSTTMAEPTEGVVPIGLPIANTQLYVLDPAGNPVPPGAPGELHIGGDGVARGYLNRAELTAERFAQNPFAPGRMYRTGDLVQFERDGRTLRFIGRVDHQVKVRGYRIELGEIEARMQTFPNVIEAVVTTREDRQGDVRIIGYLRASGPVPHDGLRAHLAETLPDYMVPSRFIELESFPLTPNAKVDRGKLPYSDEAAGAPAERIHLPPKDDTERSIADVFMRVLGVGNIGLADNFFALGGHSLLAIQAHRELKQTIAPELTVTDLFRFPTVGGLASHLRDRGAADDRLMSVAERAAMRRNRMQQRVVTRV